MNWRQWFRELIGLETRVRAKPSVWRVDRDGRVRTDADDRIVVLSAEGNPLKGKTI